MLDPAVAVIYKSNECSHMFSSEHIAASVMYPLAVMYECSLCGRTHNYTVQTVYDVSTPSKRKSFDIYCGQLFINDTNVKIQK